MDNTTELQKNQKEKIFSNINLSVHSIQKVHESTRINTPKILAHEKYDTSTTLSIPKQTNEENNDQAIDKVNTLKYISLLQQLQQIKPKTAAKISQTKHQLLLTSVR